MEQLQFHFNAKGWGGGLSLYLTTLRKTLASSIHNPCGVCLVCGRERKHDAKYRRITPIILNDVFTNSMYIVFIRPFEVAKHSFQVPMPNSP